MDYESLIYLLGVTFQIVGTYMLSTKIIGFNLKQIVKNSTSKTISLNSNKRAYIEKEFYLATYKDNFFASIGMLYIIIGIIINILDFKNNYIFCCSMLYIIAISIILLIIGKFITLISTNVKRRKLKEKIFITDELIEEGVVAIETFDSDE